MYGFFYISKKIVKNLFNSCQNSQVRVNSLVCLGKILEYLDKWFVLDDILPFLQQIPSKEPAVLMGILGNKYFQLSPLLYFDVVNLRAFCIIDNLYIVLLQWPLKSSSFWCFSLSLFTYVMYCCYFWTQVHIFVAFKAQCNSEFSLQFLGCDGPHSQRGCFPWKSVWSVFFQMLLELLRYCCCLLLLLLHAKCYKWLSTILLFFTAVFVRLVLLDI